MIHEVKCVVVLAQCLQGTFTDSLNEAHERMRNVSA
jgi:hypothetical protein